MRLRLVVVVIAVLAALVATRSSVAQATNPEGSFTFLTEVPANVAALRANVRPNVYQPVRVNWDALNALLAAAPLEDTPAAAQPLTITLPMPEGYWARFSVVESPIMEPALAATFPTFKTYLGRGIDDPYATLRFDTTMHGFHAQIFSPEGVVYVDPFSFDDTSVITSYYKKDLTNTRQWSCDTIDEGVVVQAIAPRGYAPRAAVTRPAQFLSC